MHAVAQRRPAQRNQVGGLGREKGDQSDTHRNCGAGVFIPSLAAICSAVWIRTLCATSCTLRWSLSRRCRRWTACASCFARPLMVGERRGVGGSVAVLISFNAVLARPSRCVSCCGAGGTGTSAGRPDSTPGESFLGGRSGVAVVVLTRALPSPPLKTMEALLKHSDLMFADNEEPPQFGLSYEDLIPTELSTRPCVPRGGRLGGGS